MSRTLKLLLFLLFIIVINDLRKGVEFSYYTTTLLSLTALSVIVLLARNQGIDRYNRGMQAYRNHQFEPALSLFIKATKLGGVEAYNVLGVMAVLGEGGHKDLTKAAYYFKWGAFWRIAEAQENLGHCYAKGHGVALDLSKAVKYLTKAAEKEEASAQVKLGVLYWNKPGVHEHNREKDYAHAYYWFEKAAYQQDPQGLYWLSLAYEMGQGVEKDGSKALKAMMQSAEIGGLDALCALGVRYLNGHGVTKNEETAVAYFQQATELGHAEGPWLLALAYRDGTGVAPNKTRALHWAKCAEDRGYWQAEALREALEQDLKINA
ncbi:tetratricopeptide repeat protein [Magnetococcus sp. PR-3]|uniref:tetratricopeptide repeat protein n=1 Tax=Magnetococcus sp. PR-3 TaxID=3120355 RepID=UPI002FCDE74A